jgi:hypothetical protein
VGSHRGREETSGRWAVRQGEHGRRAVPAQGRRGAAARGRQMRGTGREDLIAKVFKILRGFL